VERDGGYYLERPEELPVIAVEGVVDGDTIEVRVDGEYTLVRVFGLAAPERDQRCYAEATEELRELVGREVGMLADEREQDRFGRPLRYLFTPDGRFIDADMVSAGVAEAWDEDGALRDELVAIERAAQLAGRGCLWSGG
jgi:micrococcal nuclease